MSASVEKYIRRSQAVDSLLCVGLDSDIGRLPEPYRSSQRPQYEFNEQIIRLTHSYTAAYKFNMAFYEARGADGWNDLARTMTLLREQYPDIYTICDAKRADIGSTNQAYVRAFFDDLGFDAITLHPYLGQEAMQPFLDRADKACIFVCRTSNPGAGELQDVDCNGRPLWQLVAERVHKRWNKNGNCMLVVGATYPAELRAVRDIVGDMHLLVPGVGTQGGDPDEAVRAGMDANGGGLIIAASRSVIFADAPDSAARSLRESLNQARRNA